MSQTGAKGEKIIYASDKDFTYNSAIIIMAFTFDVENWLKVTAHLLFYKLCNVN